MLQEIEKGEIIMKRINDLLTFSHQFKYIDEEENKKLELGFATSISKLELGGVSELINYVEILFKQFDTYYDLFQENENLCPNILRKYKHSIRVMNIALELAIFNNMSVDDLKTIAICGLLHDVARPVQFKKYNTYNDNKSVDHGDFGYDLLFNCGVKYLFTELDHKKERLLALSVINHNKLKIQNDISEIETLFCRIIKDADKLDVYNSYINHELKYDEYKIDNFCLKVIERFNNREQINFKTDLPSKYGDIPLVSLVWMFELSDNIDCLEYLLKNDILNQLFEILERKEVFKTYFYETKLYLEEKRKSFKKSLVK